MKLEQQVIKVYKGEHGYFTRLCKHDDLYDEWQTAFVYIQFRKGENVEDKSNILVKDSRLSFYKSKENKIVLYIFVKEYELVENID